MCFWAEEPVSLPIPTRSLTFLPGFLIPLPGLSGAHRASGARPIVLTREQLDIVSRGLVPAELQRNRRVQIGCATAAVSCRQPAWLLTSGLRLSALSRAELKRSSSAISAAKRGTAAVWSGVAHRVVQLRVELGTGGQRPDSCQARSRRMRSRNRRKSSLFDRLGFGSHVCARSRYRIFVRTVALVRD